MDVLTNGMRKLFIPLIVGLSCAPQLSLAQISPGELSKVHASLEGITNCSECHESGREISGAKCLACHSEIKKDIDARRGYHFLTSASTCISCHKDHLGKEAKITQFDQSQFDHAKAGFALVGKHGSLKCEQCHTDKFVTSVEVKKVQKDHPHKTFLGLEQRCVSCHADRHKGTVSTECQTCHTVSGWKPAASFDHAKAKYPLAGKHKPIECAKCHAEMSNRGPSDILFSTKNYSDCKPCHTSPHGSKFTGKSCKSCHSAEGWKVVTSFNHADTRYPLAGKHQTVACEKCHLEMAVKKGQNVDLRTKDFADCRPCHASPHQSSFGDRQCKACHVPTAWSTLALSPFDHNLTRYKLVGRHSALQCEKCHKQVLQKSTFARRFLLSYSRCADCHADYHKGQLTLKYSDDCARCHTEYAYRPSLYTMALHSETRFPLKGAHAAVPCDDCHKKSGQKESVFRFASIRCEACHADKHNGQFDKFMKGISCERCHSTSDWKSTSFDHLSTKFQLVGKHLSVRCADCHKEQLAARVKSFKYQGVPTECESCHKDPHFGQFAQGGETRCSVCHSPAAWRTLLFNHETQSVFKLTGAHINVPCRSCHKEERVSGQTFVRYKPLPTKCESCHQGIVK
jgi:hypothetical protein